MMLLLIFVNNKYSCQQFYLSPEKSIYRFGDDMAAHTQHL